MMFKTVELLCKKTMSDAASPVSVVEHYKCNWRSWTWKINVEWEGKWDFEWSNTCVNYSCTVFLCKCSQWTERLFTESGCCCWWWWYVGITWTCSSVHRLRSCLELRADFVNSVMDIIVVIWLNRSHIAMLEFLIRSSMWQHTDILDLSNSQQDKNTSQMIRLEVSRLV